MAENQGAWGIEIGQAGLKAIRLRYADAAEQAVAVAFDYVPHAKILSQPDAIPEELIPQALETFLSRNEVKGDKIAISVPGHTSLARFIQLPPVESSKVAEIVKYEARQQIPFALEDVIWDYQKLSGGQEESGFMLEAEVGLFAMKREQVMQQLKPFTDAKVEIDLIQVAPLAMYNVLTYDQLGVRRGSEVSGDENYIMLDMGTDNTTLLISNGEKVWIRNVPIGGNHFTRALTKEMKLTFAKAEHLKCNATKSPDPRAVFQALRPVFNDYVSEIQRSIGYFSSVNRDAKISKVLGVGNGFKLAGLQKFLQQNLQYEVERLDTFEALVGDAVLNAPLFQENVLTFCNPYGLAVQGLELTRIHTTLLPPEIALARKIRRKKPWAITTAASLLFGLATTVAAGYAPAWHSVSTSKWNEAEEKAESLGTQVSGYKSRYDSASSEHADLTARSDQLIESLDTRTYWLELYKAINECLPRDEGRQRDVDDPEKQNRIKLTSITSDKSDDLAAWFNGLKEQHKERMTAYERENPPEGAGYIFTVHGVHYHHDPDKPKTGQGILYVMAHFLSNLQKWTVPDHAEGRSVPVRKLGLSHATILSNSRKMIPYDPEAYKRAGESPMGPMGTDVASGGVETPGAGDPFAGEFDVTADPAASPTAGGNPASAGSRTGAQKEIHQTTFVMQFVWQKTPASERPEQDPALAQGGDATGQEPGTPP